MPRTEGVSSSTFAPDFAQTQSAQRCFLHRRPPRLTADLPDRDCSRFFFRFSHVYAPAAASALSLPGAPALLNDFLHALAAALRDEARALLLLQRIEGRAHHVVGIGRAETLCHHIADAEALEHRAHRTAGDDARALIRGTHDHLARAVPADGLVMQRAAVLQRNAQHGALRGIGRLANGFRHFARLAMPEADAAALIADHDESRKTEAPAAFHHFGNAIDVHELIDEIAVAVLSSRSRDSRATDYPFCQNSRPPSRAASASALTRP